MSLQRVRSMLEAAERRNILNYLSLNAFLARSPGRAGAATIAKALSQMRDEAPWTQSERERDFLELVREAGLPEPSCNVVVEGQPVDFYWPRHRLVVEVDGYGYHRSKSAFEDDRLRDTRLQLAGIRVIRVTRDRLKYQPAAVLADVRRLLGL